MASKDWRTNMWNYLFKETETLFIFKCLDCGNSLEMDRDYGIPNYPVRVRHDCPVRPEKKRGRMSKIILEDDDVPMRIVHEPDA